MSRTFFGFGFGPIQSGLFLYEAFHSGVFDRLVVAEVSGDVVRAVRKAAGRYTVNIAERDRVSSQTVSGLEIYNPKDATDQAELIDAIAESTEIATALPAVEFYDRDDPSPAEVLAAGLTKQRQRFESPGTIIYAAENHLKAAQILRDLVRAHVSPEFHAWFDEHVQFVNTVIGKMSGVIDDPHEIACSGLQPLIKGGTRAILVEQFNHILIERVRLPGFERGLSVFEEKVDLLPFEEAKLYGHNAAHALMGYLAQRRDLQFISEIRGTELGDLVLQAFLEESGAALCQRYVATDPLFTAAGWESYAKDLLERMTNPYLRDKVARIVRDPIRKLGWNDRLIGTMRLALTYEIQPKLYSRGAAAALEMLMRGRPGIDPRQVLHECWRDCEGSSEEQERVAWLVLQAYETLS